MNKQTQINFIEEDKWLLGVTSFECTNFAFIIIDENNSFSLRIPCQWDSEDGEELINEINKLLELRSENDIELHVKEVEERGTRIEVEISGYNLASFDHFKNEFISELKRLKYRDVKHMVRILQLTHNEIVNILDVKYIAGSTKRYILPLGSYEINHNNLTLKSLLPKDGK